MAAKVTERLWEIGDIVWVLEAWGGRPSEAVYLGGRPWNGLAGNIDSGYSNLQFGYSFSGSRRNLDYLLIRRTLSEWGQ